LFFSTANRGHGSPIVALPSVKAGVRLMFLMSDKKLQLHTEPLANSNEDQRKSQANKTCGYSL
jgi:hypothetical protein